MTAKAKPTLGAIRPATNRDLPYMIALLEASSLPTVGIMDGLVWLVVAEHDDAIIGLVGLEACGNRLALLRSTVVAEAWRRRDLGRRLVARALNDARAQRIEEVYLLTTTAEAYFSSLGFAKVGREGVPAEIRATDEFAGACPASATVMLLRLRYSMDEAVEMETR